MRETPHARDRTQINVSRSRRISATVRRNDPLTFVSVVEDRAGTQQAKGHEGDAEHNL
jgi:hypothetical protein